MQDNKKILYLIGFKYAVSFLFVKNQKLTQDLQREKHGYAFWRGARGKAPLPKKILYYRYKICNLIPFFVKNQPQQR